MSLAGKVCLVTGATRGIGKGIALQLGEAGATVYITGEFSLNIFYFIIRNGIGQKLYNIMIALSLETHHW